ncbi:MAG TPA: hypothetical protein VF193_07570 [Steroidobacter sp.]
MTDQVEIHIPRPRVQEGSAFTATAYFRDRATSAASAPSTVKYRIDNLTTGDVEQDWTSVSAGASVSISVTATHNAIRSPCNTVELKQLTVAANPDTETQVRQSIVYEVANIRGF